MFWHKCQNNYSGIILNCIVSQQRTALLNSEHCSLEKTEPHAPFSLLLFNHLSELSVRWTVGFVLKWSIFRMLNTSSNSSWIKSSFENGAAKYFFSVRIFSFFFLPFFSF